MIPLNNRWTLNKCDLYYKGNKYYSAKIKRIFCNDEYPRYFIFICKGKIEKTLACIESFDCENYLEDAVKEVLKFFDEPLCVQKEVFDGYLNWNGRPISDVAI